jgi:uroporphyrinogen decarboxylase
VSMTPRERVLCALSHEEPDRVPLSIGTSGATTVLGPSYEGLKAHLGLPAGPIRWLSRTFQYTLLDEEVMVRLHGDGRPLAPGPAESALRREISDDRVIDDWGVPWRRAPEEEEIEDPLQAQFGWKSNDTFGSQEWTASRRAGRCSW